MLSERSSVDIHALHRQGFTISEIARRTEHDRKTIRAYLNGERQPGVRVQAPDPFEEFVDYVTARLTEDPHLWAQTLLDELRPLGFTGSYPTLTRQIRTRSLRPACLACSHVTRRANAVIDHPPGEETQFDWLELPDPPLGWGFPSKKASDRWAELASPETTRPWSRSGRCFKRTSSISNAGPPRRSCGSRSSSGSSVSITASEPRTLSAG